MTEELTKDNIVDLKTYTNKNLTFRVKEIGFYSKQIDIFYNNKKPLIIFPTSVIINMVHDEKNNYNITTSFDAENVYNHHKFIQLWNIAINRKVKEFSNNIETIFPHAYHDRTEKGYRKKYVIINFKTTQNTKYFNKDKKSFSHHALSVGDKVVVAAHTKGIFLDGEMSNQAWTAHQVIALTNSLNISSSNEK